MNMREKIARTLFDVHEKGRLQAIGQWPDDADVDYWLSQADAALAAMREPTEAMLEAHEALCVFRSETERADYRDSVLREAWTTMIDAARSS